MKKNIEIYSLCDPDTFIIRYIGKAINSQKRFKGHIRDSKRRNTPVYRWIRKLLSENKKPILGILEIVPEKEWEIAEKKLINSYKSNNLLNVAIGGNQLFVQSQQG